MRRRFFEAVGCLPEPELIERRQMSDGSIRPATDDQIVSCQSDGAPGEVTVDAQAGEQVDRTVGSEVLVGDVANGTGVDHPVFPAGGSEHGQVPAPALQLEVDARTRAGEGVDDLARRSLRGPPVGAHR